ncbi:amidohydrolase family protein [Microbulbifer sp. SSSA002]|uniref:amidohydrolase family protein n=1 Tax=Microbulbifer sp. SSSA002 TaxID=3243376 RepID=UPI004039821B
MQAGLKGPLRSSESGRPAHIEGVALDSPDLKIVFGHIGYPWHNEMIAFATKFPNIYIAPPHTNLSTILRSWFHL